MSSTKASQTEELERTKRAVRIIRRLDENPQDKAAQRERDAFLALGRPEQLTFQRTLRAVGGAGQGLRRDRRRHYGLALLGGLLASLAFAWQPIKLSITADFQSERSTKSVQLASGDTITLDAASAISDESSDGVRTVSLLKGAGFFDVDTSEESFVVQVGDLRVETLGTAFEVSKSESSIIVAVAKGAVLVSKASEAVQVNAGERIRWQVNPAPALEEVGHDDVAAWRHDTLIADGMTVGEVAAIIDRRIAGPVFVLTKDLKATIVSGRLDLSRPADALRTLAATVDGHAVSSPFLGAVIRP